MRTKNEGSPLHFISEVMKINYGYLKIYTSLFSHIQNTHSQYTEYQNIQQGIKISQIYHILNKVQSMTL